IEDGQLTVRRPEDERATYHYSKLAGAIAGASAGLRDEIATRIRLPRLWGHAVVVVWPSLEGGGVGVDRVTYVSGKNVDAWLRGLPAALSSESVAGVSEAVRQLAD